MKAILKNHMVVLVPEGAQEVKTLATWEEENRGHVFSGASSGGSGYVMTSMGPREEVCREPILITSMVDNPQWRLISNFSHAPFTLDGRNYASVEGFWQGLKFAPERDRRRLAMMPGPAARHEGEAKGYGAKITYEGQSLTPGTWEHWVLMENACRAKFTQDAAAKAALLATGGRPLEHKMKHDSHTIPGAIMAEIWMRIRDELMRPPSLHRAEANP